MEVYVDDETKLTLHGLRQHYVKLDEKEKNRKLLDLLDALEFNQVKFFFFIGIFNNFNWFFFSSASRWLFSSSQFSVALL